MHHLLAKGGSRRMDVWSQRWLTDELKSYAKDGSWAAAIAAFQKCTRTSMVTPNIYHYTTLISACVRGKAWEQALMIHSNMIQENIEPNTHSLAALLEACRAGQRCDLSLRLLGHAMISGSPPLNAYVSTSVVNACGQQGQWDRAIMVLKELSAKGVEVNVFTYTSAINGCVRAGGKWDTAFMLYNDMTSRSIRPSSIALHTLLSACTTSQNKEAALEVFAVMRAHGFPITRYTKECMASIGCDLCVEESEPFIEEGFV
eukprot:PhM_4_TR2269/c0_g1_i1/m.76851